MPCVKLEISYNYDGRNISHLPGITIECTIIVTRLLSNVHISWLKASSVGLFHDTGTPYMILPIIYKHNYFNGHWWLNKITQHLTDSHVMSCLPSEQEEQ